VRGTGGDGGSDEGGKCLGLVTPGRVTFTRRSSVISMSHGRAVGEETWRFQEVREAQQRLNIIKRKRVAEADSLEIWIREQINSLSESDWQSNNPCLSPSCRLQSILDNDNSDQSPIERCHEVQYQFLQGLSITNKPPEATMKANPTALKVTIGLRMDGSVPGDLFPAGFWRGM